MPDRPIAGIADRLFGETVLGRLELLQADDVGFGQRQPAQQERKPAVDAVDVIGGDLHRRAGA
jgi:hypothetical protein